jgi:hypothetical protein
MTAHKLRWGIILAAALLYAVALSFFSTLEHDGRPLREPARRPRQHHLLPHLPPLPDLTGPQVAARSHEPGLRRGGCGDLRSGPPAHRLDVVGSRASSLAFLADPLVHDANLYDLHVITLATAFLVGSVWGFSSGRTTCDSRSTSYCPGGWWHGGRRAGFSSPCPISAGDLVAHGMDDAAHGNLLQRRSSSSRRTGFVFGGNGRRRPVRGRHWRPMSSTRSAGRVSRGGPRSPFSAP